MDIDTFNLSDLLESYTLMAERTESAIQKAPDGKLYPLLHQKKHPQYYLSTLNESSQKKEKKYLPNSQRTLAQKLAQKEYDIEFLNEIQKQIKLLRELNDTINPSHFMNIYENLHPAKKLLVQPRILPDDQFLKHWYETNPGCQNPYPFEESFKTERGELVRSKSEKIIADKLFLRGIPYQYETTLPIPKQPPLYPDFTVLNTRTRKTYYFEHFGKMDDPDYCRRTLEKISLYQKNGYELGNPFIFTMESSRKSIDLQLVDLFINRYFL